MISRLFLVCLTLMSFSCAQFRTADSSSREPSSQKSALADLIKTTYGERAVCSFNNAIEVNNSSVITQFSLSFLPGYETGVWPFASYQPPKIHIYYRAMSDEFSRDLAFRLSNYSGVYISEELLSEASDANQAKKIFNNHRNIYLQEVRSSETEFSLYHEGPINFVVKEFRKFPNLVPDQSDAVIGKVTLYTQHCRN